MVQKFNCLGPQGGNLAAVNVCRLEMAVLSCVKGGGWAESCCLPVLAGWANTGHPFGGDLPQLRAVLGAVSRSPWDARVPHGCGSERPAGAVWVQPLPGSIIFKE